MFKRRSYTIKDKLDVVKKVKLEYVGNLTSASRSLEIDRKQLRERSKTESKFVESAQSSKRFLGAGCKPALPELEQCLYAWFKEQRKERMILNYKRILRLERELELGTSSISFIDKWIYNFCQRHSIKNRRVKHQGQQDNRDRVIIKTIIQDHLRGVEQLTLGYDAAHILNMDQTPCYIDMTTGTTMDFIGNKNVDAAHTGNDKHRFTTVLCITASGNFLKSVVILKGLKKLPKCDVPSNIHLAVYAVGSMNEALMLQWIDKVLRCRGPFISFEPSVLFMDSHRSHSTPEVIHHLKQLNILTKIIPPKMTPFLQPLDVSGGVYGIFKSKMREQWNDWFENGEKEFTPKGYRMRPSYGQLLQMVSKAVISCERSTVARSFQLSGIAPNGEKVAITDLNSRLRGSLGYNVGLVEGDMDVNDDDASDVDDGDPFGEIELFD